MPASIYVSCNTRSICVPSRLKSASATPSKRSHNAGALLQAPSGLPPQGSHDHQQVSPKPYSPTPLLQPVPCHLSAATDQGRCSCAVCAPRPVTTRPPPSPPVQLRTLFTDIPTHLLRPVPCNFGHSPSLNPVSTRHQRPPPSPRTPPTTTLLPPPPSAPHQFSLVPYSPTPWMRPVPRRPSAAATPGCCHY